MTTRHLALFVLALVLSLAFGPCTAQTASCATPTISNVSFGNITLQSAVTNVTGTINWSCTSSGILGLLLAPQASVAMCLNVNVGTGGAQANPRLMSNGTNTLNYQLYTTSGETQIWGSTSTAATPIPFNIPVSIPAALLLNSTVTGSTSFYAQLPGAQTQASTGAYTTTLTATMNGSYNIGATQPSSCTAGTNALNTATTTFTATATVLKACLVTASAINLGSVPSSAINTTTSGAINVTCSNATPYYVGLSPSNGNTAGAGVMSGTISGNTNKVPYQLTSTAGPSGTPWGNTSTATAVGNGVAGAGSGLSQPISVYVTAPNANFIPDTYSDTVTINVNY